MTNVIPFRQPSPKPQSYLLLTTLVNPKGPLEEGGLVAFGWPREDGTAGNVMFFCWWGPTGRDGNGRFVKKGSPEEHFATDGMRYCVNDLNRGRIKVLGKVVLARDDGERLTLPPKFD
jgi:hypothetical protein